MNNLRIALLQTPLYWENPALNRQMLAWKIRDLGGEADLVVLPEMMTSGFTMHPEKVAETMDGPTLQEMQGWSHETGAALCGSLVIREDGRFYNRLVWVEPEGRVLHYDKRHLFGLSGEDGPYTPGHQRLLITWRDWRILPAICYDLRFPVWCRNTDDHDLLLVVANWPEPRRRHWQALLTARAIENQCYVAGVNRIGRDDNGHEYAGDTALIDYQGETLLNGANVETVLTATLDKEALLRYRERLPFLADRDPFSLRNS